MGDALRISRSAAMRLRTHRDESRFRQFDLTGGGSHPWSIDLVVVTVSALLVVGFAFTLVACGSTDRGKHG
jgi:hypothetical protein